MPDVSVKLIHFRLGMGSVMPHNLIIAVVLNKSICMLFEHSRISITAAVNVLLLLLLIINKPGHALNFTAFLLRLFIKIIQDHAH